MPDQPSTQARSSWGTTRARFQPASPRTCAIQWAAVEFEVCRTMGEQRQLEFPYGDNQNSRE